MTRSASVLVALCLSLPASAATLEVGPGKTWSTPCAAVAVAQDGDTIEIDAAGNYAGDVCVIPQSRLTLRGVNGRPHIDAAGQNAGGKAIWVIQGNDVLVENVELSGCTVPDLNGAGIRAEGGNLTVRNSVLHDNQDGILTGNNSSAQLTLEDDEFYGNGSGDWGYTHNIYVGHIGRFTMTGCWSHALAKGPDAGHLVKSRAAVNEILYNRLTDDTGVSSRAIDLPNGGTSFIIGNVIQQSSQPVNKQLIGYLLEGSDPANPDLHLYVVGNTLVNDAASGTLIGLGSGAQATIEDNLFVGGGTISDGTPTLVGNLETDQPGFVDRAGFDYHLTAGSPAIDAAPPPGSAFDGTPLAPQQQYQHPLATVPRPQDTKLDVGAYEYAQPGGTMREPGTMRAPRWTGASDPARTQARLPAIPTTPPAADATAAGARVRSGCSGSPRSPSHSAGAAPADSGVSTPSA